MRDELTGAAMSAADLLRERLSDLLTQLPTASVAARAAVLVELDRMSAKLVRLRAAAKRSPCSLTDGKR